MSFKIYRHNVLNDERSKIFNFLKDGRKYYVYRITDLNTKESYYGSRASQNENLVLDFWKYGTSSKRKTSILRNTYNYKLKIIKVFDNYDDMIIYESFLHDYFNVQELELFFNEANQTPFGFTNNRSGCKLSETHKDKISENNGRGMLGKKHSIETKQQWSKIRKGVRITEETKVKISMANIGIKKTTEHKRKISEAHKGHQRSSGEQNGNAKIIEIFDSTGCKQYSCQGNFKEVCNLNNLPFSALSNSYRAQGKPIWDRPQYATLAKKRNEEKFIGWYATIQEKGK